MTQAHRRDDLSDKSWTLLKPHLPRQAGQWGGVDHDNRKVQREYDPHLYRQRHLVENAFLHIKQWRGIMLRAMLRI